jgi:hypothetical protein
VLLGRVRMESIQRLHGQALPPGQRGLRHDE